jgi:hypothetical protein
MLKVLLKVRTILLAVIAVVVSIATAYAQVQIVSLDSAYRDSIQSDIGSVVPLSGASVHFGNVGFTVSTTGYDFTTSSYSLTSGTFFDVSDVRINTTQDTLLLNIDFQVNNPTQAFGPILDTLKINTTPAATAPFILPLKGNNVPFSVFPASILFPYYVVSPDTSGVQHLSITTVNQDVGRFTYQFVRGTHFILTDTVVTPGTITSVVLGLEFVAPAEEPQEYLDTLIVSHPVYPDLVYRVPVSAHTTPIRTSTTDLDFGWILVGTDTTAFVTVDFKNITIPRDSIRIVGSTAFTDTVAIAWDSISGGSIGVRFAPDTVGYFSAYLTGRPNDSPYSFAVLVRGSGGVQPVLSAEPDSVNFGDIAIGDVGNSGIITVVLTNPRNQLDYNSFSFATSDGPFFVESVLPGASVSPDTAYVVLAFFPKDETEYIDTLIVKADYATDLKIPLYGNGVEASPAPQLSPSAVSGAEKAAAQLSVKKGDIVVSGAPTGSTLRVYNLQGQALKRQTVTSDKETLKMQSLPQSVYIVVVDDNGHVILRQKVVL